MTFEQYIHWVWQSLIPLILLKSSVHFLLLGIRVDFFPICLQWGFPDYTQIWLQIILKQSQVCLNTSIKDGLKATPVSCRGMTHHRIVTVSGKAKFYKEAMKSPNCFSLSLNCSFCSTLTGFSFFVFWAIQIF